MSAFSSASTIDQLKAGYMDNGTYVEDNSPTKCAAFISCCTLLLIKIPTAARQGDSLAIDMDVGLIRDQLNDARKWLATSPASAQGGGVRVSDFGGFRN